MYQFFGVSKDTWKKKKEELLLHLQQFYEYECAYNKFDRRKLDYHIIRKIKDYEPPKGKKARQNEIYSKQIVKVIEKDNWQTPSNVSRIIKDNKEIVALKHKDGTIYENNRYITLEEEQITFLYQTFHNIRKENKKDDLSICSEYESGLISKEEMQEALSNNSLNCFIAAKQEFKEKYNHFPVKVPLYKLSAYTTNE